MDERTRNEHDECLYLRKQWDQTETRIAIYSSKLALSPSKLSQSSSVLNDVGSQKHLITLKQGERLTSSKCLTINYKFNLKSWTINRA